MRNALNMVFRTVRKPHVRLEQRNTFPILGTKMAEQQSNKFEKCDMSNAVFHDVKLEGSNFNDVNLSNVVFENINMSKTRFNNMNISESVFTDCNLGKIQISESCILGMTINGINVLDAIKFYQAAHPQEEKKDNQSS